MSDNVSISSNNLDYPKTDKAEIINFPNRDHIEKLKPDYLRYSFLTDDIKTHFDTQFDKLLSREESVVKHIVGMSDFQKKRLFSCAAAFLICGILIAFIVVRTFLPIQPPIFFLLSLLFPALGVATSCFMALREGGLYDNKSD